MSEQNQTLTNLRNQFAAELERDSKTANELSQQLQALANKREQLKGAIFAMDASLQQLQAAADAAAKASTEGLVKSEATAETKEEAKSEEVKEEAKTEEATAVTAEQ